MSDSKAERPLDRLALALLGLRGAPLVLASRSPRRRGLLESLRVPLVCVEADVEEGNWDGREAPAQYVERLSAEKLAAAREHARTAGGYVVLAADTVVEIDGDVLEKPIDRDHAVQLLGRLAGRDHRVWTGLALERLADGRGVRGSERSVVHFDALSARDIDAYLDTGEPMDKAGAYGIQGWGGLFVSRIEGDYFNVMGLPLARLRALCREMEDGAPAERGA